jgi:tetratricopeptide (TPR) repeat protein
MLGLQRWAEQAFCALLAGSPHHTGALGSLAHLTARSGRIEQALVLQQRCTERQTDHAGAWFNLGYLCEQSLRPQEAEDAFRRALALSPKLDQAWYALGLVLFQQGRHAEALPALAENTRLQPYSPHGWVLMARVQHCLGLHADCRVTIDHLRGFDPKAAMGLERALSPAAVQAPIVPVPGGAG